MGKPTVALYIALLVFLLICFIGAFIQRNDRDTWFAQCMKTHPVAECERGLAALRGAPPR